MRHAAWILIIVSLGCGSSAEPTSQRTEPQVAAPPEAPSGPAGPRVEQETFTLEAIASPSGYTAGQPGAVTIRLQPKAGWHVNQDFPVQIDLRGPAELGLAKTQLARADAAAFDEQQFRFEAALLPTSAGARTLAATVNFAICTDENCLPQQAELALPLDVH